jgi:hypothetical protein
VAGRVENPEVCPSAAAERPPTQPGSLDYNPYWSQYLVVAVLGAKAVGQRLLPRPAIRYRCARRQSRIRQLVRSAIDENGELEHEA